MLPSLSVALATTPGRHLAAGRVASFAEGRIGYQEWARRNGQLGDIHSIDDRHDHEVDELMACDRGRHASATRERYKRKGFE